MKNLFLLLVAGLTLSVSGQSIAAKYIGKNWPDTTLIDTAYGELFLIELESWNDTLIYNITIYPCNSEGKYDWSKKETYFTIKKEIETKYNFYGEGEMSNIKHQKLDTTQYESCLIMLSDYGMHYITLFEISKNNPDYYGYSIELSPVIDPTTGYALIGIPNSEKYVWLK